MRASNYKHNKELFLPQAENTEIEACHETRRVELNRIFNRVSNAGIAKLNQGSSNQNPISESNLTADEISGLKSLKRKIKNGSIFLCETDKSKRFAVLSKSQYIASGKVHTDKDIKISPDEIKRTQNHVNDHTWWLNKIINAGANWGHEDRMAKNVIDKGEQACHMH